MKKTKLQEQIEATILNAIRDEEVKGCNPNLLLLPSTLQEFLGNKDFMFGCKVIYYKPVDEIKIIVLQEKNL